MAGIETLSRPAKKYYEQYKGQRQAKEIWDALFPVPDMDTASTFSLDSFTSDPYGIVYRDRDNPSHVRPYEGGTGRVIDLPRASEKTRIGEELRDAAIVGLDVTAGQAVHYRKLVADITKQHIGGHVMTRRKQALDVIFASSFYALGSGGKDLDLDIAYTRAAGNTQTHDFTATDTIPIAFKEMQDQLIDQGCSTDNMAIICGTTYLQKVFSDTSVQTYLDSNEANMLLRQDMQPALLQNTWGLRIHAVYRAPEMVAPVYVCSYSPGVQYKQYNGAAAAAWVTATKAAMFSMDSERYNVERGMDVINEAGRVERAVGEIVFDTFHSDDPIGDYMRSSTRHAFVPGNTNHICTSTGTFA